MRWHKRDAKVEEQEQEAKRPWAHLPVIEQVLQYIATGANPGNAKDMFSIAGVCQYWRAAAHEVFFSNSWQQPTTVITHPCQLYTLCPLLHAKGGHIKCFIQRDHLTQSVSGKQQKYRLYQGGDHTNRAHSRFLLAAVQHIGSRSFEIFMNHQCTGKPIARLSGSLLGTGYDLVSYLGSSSMMHGSGSSAGGLLHVNYKLRMRGMMLPRRMNVTLPSAQQQQQRQQRQLCRPANSHPAGRAAGTAGSVRQQQQQHLNSRAAAAAASYGYGSSTIIDHAEIVPDLAPQGDRQDHAGSSSSNANGGSGSSSGHKGLVTNACLSGQLPQQQQQQQQMHHLHNKAPHWNDALHCWCLNFRGRVKLASVKNFQLVTNPKRQQQQQQQQQLGEGGSDLAAGSSNHQDLATNSSSSNGSHLSDSSSSSSGFNLFDSSSSSSSTASEDAQSDHQLQRLGPLAAHTATAAAAAAGGALQGSPNTNGIVVQFGKVESDVFVLDYDPVLASALQAFAIALTTFGNKVLL